MSCYLSDPHLCDLTFNLLNAADLSWMDIYVADNYWMHLNWDPSARVLKDAYLCICISGLYCRVGCLMPFL